MSINSGSINSSAINSASLEVLPPGTYEALFSTGLLLGDEINTAGSTVSMLASERIDFGINELLSIGLTLSEIFNVFDLSSATPGFVFSENVVLSDKMTVTGVFGAAFASSIKLTDKTSLAFMANFIDSITVDDSIIMDRKAIMDLVERLVVSGEVDSTHNGILALSEALAITSSLDLGFGISLSEGLNIVDGSSVNVVSVFAALESIVFGETMIASASIILLAEESLMFSDSLGSVARMVIALEEGLFFGGVIHTPEESYDAWVVNVETKAPWQYDNYPFNSFAKVGGEYLAVSDSGLYSLSGDTDDGDIINAKIKTGLDSFESSNMKSIPVAYFGYTASGRVLFKTITTEAGNKIERWYELKEKTADDTTEGKVKMGRGVRAVYWQFEIENIDGADFDLDSVRLLPAVLKRRI